MKSVLTRLKKANRSPERGWFRHLFGSRVRTSTLVFVIAFVAMWWLYLNYQRSSESGPNQVPATEVVPPGFIPDPSYTWVPRTRLQQPPATVTETVTPTPSTTETTTPTSEPGSPGSPGPPLFPFPPPPPAGSPPPLTVAPPFGPPPAPKPGQGTPPPGAPAAPAPQPGTPSPPPAP